MNAEPPRAEPEKVDQFCAYCWPRLKPGAVWDPEGMACCDECAGNPNRKRRLPAFHSGHLGGWSKAA